MPTRSRHAAHRLSARTKKDRDILIRLCIKKWCFPLRLASKPQSTVSYSQNKCACHVTKILKCPPKII